MEKISHPPTIAQIADCSEIRGASAGKKIWIDLDNSPHVPFFAPIIEELEKRDYSVLLTARDCFQVPELADLLGLKYKLIGHHYGKNTGLKLFGLGVRALQMLPLAVHEKPVLAVSHGSRSQLLLSSLLRIPSVIIGDYEFATISVGLSPRWLIRPEVIPAGSAKQGKTRLLTYPGIKEDIYAAKFKPEPRILRELGLEDGRLIITLRPPATEAHYHVPESERMFEEVLNFLGDRSDIKMILLPRNKRQGTAIREAWPKLFSSGRVIIPDHVVDGLNLVWYSDLVISGGGTMNREATALGVPVYSIFAGKIGAVDQYLASQGRMVLLRDTSEVRTKLLLNRRDRPANPTVENKAALHTIVEHIVSIAEARC